jgi:glycosyltransferase involved in cell wall biosynthesis
MIKVLGLSLYGPLAASTRYRLSQYTQGLLAAGIDLQVKPLLSDVYIQRSFNAERYPLAWVVRDYVRRVGDLLGQKKYDAAIVNAEIFPLLPGGDDAFFLKYRLERFSRVSFLLKDKFNPVVQKAAAVTAGNRHLAGFAESLNANTQILPTVVDTQRYVPQPGLRTGNKPFTIGWIGSPSTSVYLSQVVRAVQMLAEQGPVRFVVVGGNCPEIPGVDTLQKQWDEASEVADINSFDVGIMPIFDDAWARGKCAFKLIQYMACGVPVIASPVGANCDVVTPDCGLLASTDAQWLQAFQFMRDQPVQRARMGDAGRERIVAHYSLHQHLPRLAEIIHQVARKK